MILSRLLLRAFSATVRATLLSALLLMTLPSVIKNLDDLQHFTACLGELYHIKVHPECVSFLGFTVDYDRVARTLSLSRPSYIPDLLTRLNIPNLRTRKSPCVHVPPNFGSKDPQVENIDASAPASKEELATLQIIIGSILHYARAVDAAVCLLASQQPAPTANAMAAAHRLLGCAKLHPNHCLVFKPSDVILRIHSDASYLNRAKSGSTAGGYHYLGTTDPDFLMALFSATALAFLSSARLCLNVNVLVYFVTVKSV
jgi:hypothetical protein